MGILTERFCFDFGSSEIRIVQNGKLILSEQPKLAIDQNNKVIAIGDDVNENTHKNIIEPLNAGIIGNFNAFEQLMRGLIKRSENKRKKRFLTPSLVSCCLIHDASSEIEIRSYRDSMEHAGCKEIYMIYSTYATALGIGIDCNKTNLIIDAGHGKTAISVLSKENIHNPLKLDFGLNKLISVTVSAIRRKYNISCDKMTIKDLLLNYLSFIGSPKIDKTRINGKSKNDVDTQIEIDLKLINQMILPYFNIITNEVIMVIEKYNDGNLNKIESIILTGILGKINDINTGLDIGYSIYNKSDDNYTTKGLILLDKDFEKNKKALK